MAETYGSGVAFLDYDNDGLLDLFLVNGGRLPGLSTAPLASDALYRNTGDGKFVDVTAQSGTADTSYGMGVAVGDYDNDGDADLYVANYGSNVLLRNEGNGCFRDFTGQAGVGDRGWGSSVAFADVDQDGNLDLYVCNYLDYPVQDPLACFIGNTAERLYCDPRKFPGQVDRFYHNRGATQGWSFEDWTEKMGLANTQGKELGVVFGDYDLDGDMDLYLANDMAPNALWRNDGSRFTGQGLASGTSLSLDGKVQAGMGVEMGDVDGDGRPELFVTNFQWESNSLYRNLGNGFFADVAVESGLHKISFPYLGFGTGFFDCDNDGDLDIFVANGHVYDNVENVDPAAFYPQRNQLLLNQGEGHFTEATDAGPGLELVEVSRGVALGDYDNDGDVDIALTNSNSRAVLLRNDGGNSRHWLGIWLRGRRSNFDGVGAQVAVEAGGKRQTRQVHGGGSYLSAHELRLHFGLGDGALAERVEVRWPGGTIQELRNVRADQYLLIEEE
ncbi:MAG: CRTAC1 family protein [Candidatus Latescibacteria bacterium]|nr:CRTAC1 family protein [Candidatus Latescibacterota bacterium]